MQKSVTVTVEFAEIEELQRNVLWETLPHVPLEWAQSKTRSAMCVSNWV